MGGNPRDALSPKGLLTAIALYRMYGSLPDGTTPPAATPPVPDGLPAEPAPNSAAALAEAGPAGNAAMQRDRSGLPPEMARIARELDSTELRDPVLGFQVRRVRR